MAAPASVEEYLAGFPDEVRALLESARSAIRRALPDAQESISYGIIRFGIAGRHAIYLAGWKKHLGIYPVPRAQGAFERELATHRAAKDALHFPYARPIPYGLVERVAGFVAGG